MKPSKSEENTTSRYNNGNFTLNYNLKLSDSRLDKLQLLAEATELSYRRLILADCQSSQQIERELMILFEDAAEALMSCEDNLKFDKSTIVARALRRAYDVFSAHMVQRDMVFQYVSYGGDDTEHHHVSIHH